MTSEQIIILAFLIFLGVSVLFLLTKIAGHIIINSLLGFGIVLILKSLGLWSFAFTIPVYLMILFGGVPGVVLIYILYLLGISF